MKHFLYTADPPLANG